MERITLEAFSGRVPIFRSCGRWLHPLFELEDFLRENRVQTGKLVIRDCIVGKAAALLMVRLGARTVHAGTLSRLGQAVLTRHSVAHDYEELVDRIDCQTEQLLSALDDVETAYTLLRKRAQAATAAQAAEAPALRA